MSKKDFHSIPFIIPKAEVVLAFEQQVFALDQQIEMNEHQSRTLATLRDTLLPKLLSGELRVRDAERWVETVI